MERTCECGRAIPPQRGPGKPRKRCATCAPPRGKAADRQDAQGLTAEPVRALAAPPDEADWPQVVAVRGVLAAAGREHAPAGVLALRLAAMVDEGGHTASGAAALARQLLATMDAALAGAPKAADRLDEIAQRRARKVGA